jgi:hypothetical protein
MSNDDTTVAAPPGDAAPPIDTAAKPASRRTFAQWALATESGFSFVKGLTFVSFGRRGSEGRFGGGNFGVHGNFDRLVGSAIAPGAPRVRFPRCGE